MKNPPPRTPQSLNPLAREVLEALRGRPEAASIVIGGGVALQHYLLYRGTMDLDAWWSQETRDTKAASRAIHETVEALARKHHLNFSVRSFGETESFELRNGVAKVFSVQIATRTTELDEPLESEWKPVKIESLRDNLAAKMNALVNRGAPRDYLDIFTACTHGIVSPAECWKLWQAKNPGGDAPQAAAAMLTKLRDIEARRPLEKIPDAQERDKSAIVRAWFPSEFARAATVWT
ncbi:MAG: nucleotidyl transferase AbiEii/AbiGii toxin family protein [Verrucomicrobiae bacterium]|nr:nucleotidyl transferase AbiEii/AbiGii toxin family protein [Verrucomicrobiae bacterium]